MKVKKDWKKRFAKSINQAIKNDKDYRYNTSIGLKDAVYLLGVAIDKDKYSHMGGFVEFCRKLDIKW